MGIVYLSEFQSSDPYPGNEAPGGTGLHYLTIQTETIHKNFNYDWYIL